MPNSHFSHNPTIAVVLYQWKLKDDELCEKLVNATKDRVSPNSEIMPLSDVHCSAHVSFVREMFEQKWFQCIDTIDLKWLIWTENRCAVTVDLRSEQQKFLMLIHSHMSHCPKRTMTIGKTLVYL